MNKLSLSLSFLILISPLAYADTIELSNRKVIEGTFSGRDGDMIKFEVDGISMTFQAKDVKNIAIGSATSTSKNQPKVEEVSKGPVSIDSGTTA